MPQLVLARVRQLLGRFDHEIEFPSDWPFVIVHGPNGVGKTKLLEMIAAVCEGHLSSLIRVPFDAAEFAFDDGTTLLITRGGQLSLPGVEADEEADIAPTRLSVKLHRNNEPESLFEVQPGSRVGSRRLASIIERELSVQQIGTELWLDHDVGDRLTTSDVIERYRAYLPSGLIDDTDELPDPYREFIAELPVHIIATQRLLVTDALRARERRTPSATVTRYADDLVRRLQAALAENATTSQTLDRTFPRRVMNAEEPGVTDDEIRARYARQGKLRNQLQAVSLVNVAAADLPLPDRDLKEWERLVLSTYLDDQETKLETFEPLLARVLLLQQIVNARFLFKTLSINRERGFVFKTDEGSEIGPQALSSGEQHELVLAYNLLFHVTPGSLVLIDEPEISLHVSWQQQFLNDLIEISKLQSLRFIVATHSPQIIHKWWAYAKALYEEPDGFPELEPWEPEQ